MSTPTFINGLLNTLDTNVKSLTITNSQINNRNLSENFIFSFNIDSSNIVSYLSVTGIEKEKNGTIKIIVNTHPTKTINFYHNNTSSSENNRLFLPDSGSFELSGYAGVVLIYLTATNRWHIIGEVGKSGTGTVAGSIGGVGGGGT